MWESIVLTTSFGRRQLRKQFCAFFAQARFHTAWVKNGSVRARAARPFYPQEQTSSACTDMSVWCHFRTHAPQQVNDHSITSSARASSVGGSCTPSCLAPLCLRINSNSVGACPG